MKESFHEITGDSCCPTVVKGSAEVEGEINRFTSLGPVGAIITAVLASLCCVGPFILVMIGASGAWIGSLRTFEPYRPIFILLTIGLLGAGFYSIYKKPKEECEPGSICATPQTKKMGKIVIWITTVFVVFLLILPYLIGLLA